MRSKRSRKYLKKYLRRRERALQKHLSLFLDNFDVKQSPDDEMNFPLLLKLRWLVYDFIYVRLKLHSQWSKKKWFFDLLDVDRIEIDSDSVRLAGDMVWWAEGKDAAGEWWPSDHKPRRTGIYKVKIRGDLDGGYWVIEPVVAKLKKARTAKRNAEYEIDFGKGSTYLKIASK